MTRETSLLVSRGIAAKPGTRPASEPRPDTPAELLELLAREPSPAGLRSRAALERALLGPAHEVLRRPGKGLRGRLTELGYVLGGGVQGRMPRELPWLVEILHAGSLVVDDVEDDAELRRGAPALHRLVGTPLAVNTGSWLYFWPFVLVERWPVPETLRGELTRALGVALMRCHQGQALDLATRIHSCTQQEVPALVATITRLKTGELMRLAAELGARVAGADEAVREQLRAFAGALGMALQRLDDLTSVVGPARRDKAEEDLRAARATWCWAWLAEREGPLEYRRLRRRARDVAEGRADVAELRQALAAQLPAQELRAGIRQELDAAVEALRTACGRLPALDVFAAQLRRWEASHG